MLLRALIVFLVVVNLGVAAWWALRTPAPTASDVSLPAGVPRLQLLQEVPKRAAPRATTAPAKPRPVAIAQCYSFGPYATPAALRRAHERVRSQVVVARVRNKTRGQPTGWRVFLAPLASAEAAQAMADRIGTAGFDDYYILPSGPEHNGIALGRFGTEAAARRHRDMLAKAGFEAQVAPLGDVASEGWIDAGASASFDRARVAQEIAAARTLPLDCARLR